VVRRGATAIRKFPKGAHESSSSCYPRLILADLLVARMPSAIVQTHVSNQEVQALVTSVSKTRRHPKEGLTNVVKKTMIHKPTQEKEANNLVARS